MKLYCWTIRAGSQSCVSAARCSWGPNAQEPHLMILKSLYLAAGHHRLDGAALVSSPVIKEQLTTALATAHN